MLILIVYWFTRNHLNRMFVISAGVSVGVAELLGKAAGILYQNMQPFAELPAVNQLIEKEINNSFPSDHTIICISIAISIWLFRRGYAFFWVFIACLSAVSRVGVGVHYPADVLVGGVIAVLSAVMVYWIVNRLPFIQVLLNK